MQLPRLYTKNNKTKKYIVMLGGINRQESFSKGQLETSENISFDSFPAISAGRGLKEPKLSLDCSFSYIYANGGIVGTKFEEGTGVTLCYIDEKEDAQPEAITVFPEAKDEKRWGAKLGKYVVVFPDKVYLDLEKKEKGFVKMEKRLDIKKLAARITSDSLEFNEDDFRTFKNTFKEGDVISLDLAWYVGNDRGGSITDEKHIIRSLDKENHRVVFDPNAFPLNGPRETSEIVIKTTAPDIKHLNVFGGRVWGCDEEGKIYASKYNDPTVWEYFDLSSSDSYTLETDTTGEFTASAVMEDHIAFFKEDKIHRITGTKPANFRHSIVYTEGVKKGGDKTLKVKDGMAYYLGCDGVYTYGGADANKISAPLGSLSFSDGAAVFHKDVYYISLKQGEKCELYGFDKDKKMWFRDGEKVFKEAFLFLGESLFQAEDNRLRKIADEKDLTRDISLTFREFTETQGEQRHYSRLFISARLKKGERLKAEADFGYGFEPLGVFTDFRKRVFEIRLKPNRCHKITLRLTASPEAVIEKIMAEHFDHGSVF